MKLLRLLPLCAALAASVAFAGIAENIDRTQVGGIDLVMLHTGVQDVVTLRGTLPVGNAAAPADNPALARLTAGMLDRGTTRHDKYAITRELENVGATLSFHAGNELLTINAKCLKHDVPLVVALIAEQLRSPAFNPEEFAKLQKQTVGALKRGLDDTDERASDAFTRAVYPAGHPNRQPPTDELIAAVEHTTLDQVKAFHAEYYGPAYLRLVVVGDVDEDAAKAEVASAFAGWTGGKRPDVPPVVGGNVDAPLDQTVYMADKTNVSVTWGQATGLRYSDPDALALRVGTSALGGGFAMRLMSTVRNQEGLTYGIYSFTSNDNLRDGDWRIWANFAPQNLEKGIASTKRQLVKWYSDGITADELAQRKTDLTGSFKVGLATTDGMANTILSTLQRGYDLKWLDEYPAKVEALTLPEVNGAIKKHLDPEKMVLVKAGTVPDAQAK